MTSIDKNYPGLRNYLAIWMISENTGSLIGISGQFVYLATVEYSTSTTQFEFYIAEEDEIQYAYSSNVYDVGTTYYITIKRNNSSIIVRIYSDSDRENLIETMQITLDSNSNINYSYVQLTVAINYFTGTDNQSDGYVQDVIIG